MFYYKSKPRLLLIIASLFVWSAIQATATSEDTEAENERILFIGNSYTRPLQKALSDMIKGTPFSGSTLEFVTPGGYTLKRHLENEETIQTIRSGNWDYVVLQEQSQTPSLPDLREQFMNASEQFCDIIKESGAEPVFFMTWGRRDGDKHNIDLNPDFETMQDKLTDAYEEAADANDAMLAPVGIAWAEIMDNHDSIGIALYHKDGSHPSDLGAYLAASMFYRLFFDQGLAEAQSDSDLPVQNVEIIRETVLATKLSR